MSFKPASTRSLTLAQRAAIENNVRGQIANNIRVSHQNGVFDAGYVICDKVQFVEAEDLIIGVVAQVYDEIVNAP